MATDTLARVACSILLLYLLFDLFSASRMDAHRFLVWKVADGLSSKGITNVHPLFSYIDISSSSSSTRL